MPGNYRLSSGITIPENASRIAIDTAGHVMVMMPGKAQPQDVGQLELAVFAAPELLRPIEGTFCVETPASGPPVIGEPGTDGLGTLFAGVYEGSNVNPEVERCNMLRV